VRLQQDSLEVLFGGKRYVGGPLARTVETGGCTWFIGGWGGRPQVTLKKFLRRSHAWGMLSICPGTLDQLQKAQQLWGGVRRQHSGWLSPRSPC